MSARQTTPPDDFFGIAADLGMIPTSRLEEIRRAFAGSGLSCSEFASDRDLLDAVEIDIVETLSSQTDVIPGYRILGMIGKGGMGVVYRAEQRNLGRLVALKTILVSRMADRSMLDRFELEARTIGQLRHPNIIAAHDFGRHAGRLYLAMELVEGTDLDRRLKETGPLDEGLAWGLARQTAAGLAHAAQHQTVHRDIKPANLMLVDPPEGYPLPPGMPMVKIADFGLALLQGDVAVDERLTAPDATVGSPHYMAPEQLETSDVDCRADMYSLGATLFHALTGRPPFAGLKLSQIIAAKLGEGAPKIGSVDASLTPATCGLVDRLLSRSPDNRPDDYRTLLADIDAVVSGLGSHSIIPGRVLPDAETEIPGGPDGDPADVTAQFKSVSTQADLRPQIATPKDRRPRATAITAGALLAALLLLTAAWWWNLGAEPPLPTVRGRGQPVGDVLPLFNGLNTAGFQIGHGNWVVEDAVLIGREGIIRRPLPPLSQPGAGSSSENPAEPPSWYRLDLQLIPPGDFDHGGAEVHFGLSASDFGQIGRYVLRRKEGRVELGHRVGGRGPFVADGRFASRTIPEDVPIAVEIERLPQGWFVDVNGDAFAGLPLEEQGSPEFRLLAEGEARFSDLNLQVLQPVEP